MSISPFISSSFRLLITVAVFSLPILTPHSALGNTDQLVQKRVKRKDAIQRIEKKHRHQMYISAALLPLVTGIGMGIGTVAAVSQYNEYNTAVATIGTTLTTTAVLLSGAAITYRIGQNNGYNGSFNHTLKQSAVVGLAGAAIGAGVSIATVAILLSQSGGCSISPLALVIPPTATIVGATLGVSLGSVTGYAKSMTKADSKVSWKITPAPIALKGSRLAVVPGLIASGTF